MRKEPPLPILITGLVADGPAATAGLKPLDRVTKIDDKDVTSADEAVAMTRGEKDSFVKLTVTCQDTPAPVEISIKRTPLLTEAQRPQSFHIKFIFRLRFKALWQLGQGFFRRSAQIG